MPNSWSATLLTDATATGDWVHWPGGAGTVFCDGDFGTGGSVAFQCEGPNGDAIAVQDVNGNAIVFTADGMDNFDLAACRVRAAISGDVGTAAIDCRVARR